MSKHLIVGDLHLGKGLGIGKPAPVGGFNSRVVDQIKLLDWILEKAIEVNVESIILTGDICEDIKPDYELISVFVEWLKRCSINYIEVHIIAGNHDLKRTGNRFSSYLDLISDLEIPDIFVYKRIDTIIKDNVGFTFLPFRDKQSLLVETNEEAVNKIKNQIPYEVESIPNHYSRVLVGHLALDGSLFVGDEFDNLAREIFCTPDMFTGYDYVWMGHVHKPQVKQEKNPYMAHVGSLDISDFGETDHTKIIVVFDTDLPNKFYHIEVPSRPLIKVAVDIAAGFDSTSFVINKIKSLEKEKSFNDSIVKVEIKLLDEELSNVDRTKILDTLYELNAYYVIPIIESRSTIVVPINQQQQIDNKIEPKEAIKVWAENYISDERKELFISESNDCIDVYFSNLK